jgi:PII-like signaling protein
MHLSEQGALLRIFIDEADHYAGKPLYEWIVLQAHQNGMAGATVLRGLLGFGAKTRQIHSFKIEALSEDQPIVIEIIDTPENLENFLDLIISHIPAGLVTMEQAAVKFYRAEDK